MPSHESDVEMTEDEILAVSNSEIKVIVNEDQGKESPENQDLQDIDNSAFNNQID
jgi:hypothetical protein